MQPNYGEPTLSRSDVDALAGATVLDFGNDWCGYCIAARRIVDPLLSAAPAVRHLRIADGRGVPLGRAFKVKLWPTLIFLLDGVEQTRLVRPESAAEVQDALHALTPTT